MPDDPQNPDSLGDDRTFVGEGDSPPEEEQSLGDEDTHVVGMASFLSDLELGGQAADSDLPLIDLATRYDIEGEHGKGGMGAVQLATDRQLKRKVAIKRIHASSPSALRRFVTEAQSIAALNHFNIVQVHDFGRDADGPLLIMEYVSGGSLLDRLNEGKLEVEDAIGITCQLCDALALAHQKGIVHRDIKPGNILLTEEGTPKLTDFGLARQESVDHGQTQAGAVLGAIDFMPPEQRQDATAIDARSDLWSLAATLYQMLTGKSPKVIRLDQLPANLAPVIGKMLEEDPGERFQTAGEFKAELRKGMAAATTTSTELAAGVCPSCGEANDANREACRGCQALLIKPCLSCESENPVWEDVCGQCGSSQNEERNLIRDRLAVVIEESLALARGHEYEKALAQLETVKEDAHTFTADIREPLAEQIKLVIAERDRQYQLRDQLVDLAKQHNHSYDYVAIIKELEKIPAPLRTGNPIGDQLSNAQAARDELASLREQVGDDVKNRRIEGLLEKARRCLVLNPGDSNIQKLHEHLLKHATQVDELLLQTEQQYDQFQDEAVLTMLDNWPQALHKPARAEQLQKLATDRLARVQELKTTIAAETKATAKLRLAEKYLQLWPGDKQALRAWILVLEQQVQAEKIQYDEAKRQHQKKRSDFITAIVLATVFLSIVAGLGIHYLIKGKATANEKAAVEKATSDQAAADQATADQATAEKAAAEKAAADQAAADQAAADQAAADQAAADQAAAEKAAAEKAAADKLAAREKAAADKAAAEKLAAETAITLTSQFHDVTSVAFSPDGKRIVSGSYDKTLKVWDAETGQELLTLKGHSEGVNGVAFSPDGKRIISGSSDKTLKVWDSETGRVTLTLEGHSQGVNSVAFSPDGKRIVSGSQDDTVRIWDGKTGLVKLTIKGLGGQVVVLSVAFSPDGKQIVIGRATRYDSQKILSVWDSETGKELLTLNGHSGSILSATFSPDGKRIVSGSASYGGGSNFKVWDAETGRQTLPTLKGSSYPPKSVAFSPDGKRIVSGSSGAPIQTPGRTESGGGIVKIWDAVTGQELLTLKGHRYGVRSVAFSPDGKRIVSASHGVDRVGSEIKVWNIASDQ